MVEVVCVPVREIFLVAIVNLIVGFAICWIWQKYLRKR